MTVLGTRHFLDLADHSSARIRALLDDALDVRSLIDRAAPSAPTQRLYGRFMEGRYVALLFEKPATRTRLHFELVTRDLGGHPIVLTARDMQMSRNETIADTARVLSRHTDLILYRALSHERLCEFAAHSTAPVINGLSDFSHPFRGLVEVMTFERSRGPIGGSTVAWVGDGNNMATSWIHAAALLDFSLRIACPVGFEPASAVLSWAAQRGADVVVHHEPEPAVQDANCVATDTWISMGQGDEQLRRRAFRPFQVDQRLMGMAKRDAVFLHPLPAYRGEEVASEVIDGPQSLAWEGGIENKRYLLEALFASLLGQDRCVMSAACSNGLSGEQAGDPV